jgi:hypothetical protein
MLRNLSFVLVSILFIFSVAQAATKDADTKEVQSFQMTDAKLDQFTKAVNNVSDAIHKNPKLVRDDESEEAPEGISAIVATIDKQPELKKAIEASGMTTRDFVLFEMAAINGALGDWVTKQGQKLPPEITPEQVQFYKTHEAKLKAIKDQMDAVEAIIDQEDDDDEGEDEE